MGGRCLALGLTPPGVELDAGPLDRERTEPGGVEPANPLAQVEPVRLERGTRLPGQEPGDRLVDALSGRVGWMPTTTSSPTVSLRWVVDLGVLLQMDGEPSRSPRPISIKLS